VSSNPKSQARAYAIQFLYQCESERLFHFSDAHFQDFIRHLKVPPALGISEIDGRIQDVSANWKLSRMSLIDRNVLRLATFELTSGITPPRVVLNEAVELAKTFGSADSGRFVNGLLDRIAKSTPGTLLLPPQV
jgi:N utilization substance protein B